MGCLNDSGQMAICCQLQTLLFSPTLDLGQSFFKSQSPAMGAVVVPGPITLSWITRHDNLIECPHVDEVKQLREELDGESGVDATLPQKVHGRGQDVHDAGNFLVVLIHQDLGHATLQIGLQTKDELLEGQVDGFSQDILSLERE